MIDREDHILEAGLAEVVGNQTPPDLSARILQAVAGRLRDANTLDTHAERFAAPIVATPTAAATPAPSLLPMPVGNSCVNGNAYINGSGVNGTNGHSHGIASNGVKVTIAAACPARPASLVRRVSWLAAAAAAIVLALVGLPKLGELASHKQDSKHEKQAPANQSPANRDGLANGTRPTELVEPIKPEQPIEIVRRPEPPPVVAPKSVPKIEWPVVDPPAVVNNLEGTGANGPLASPTKQELRTVPAKSDAEVIAAVDRRIREGWLAAGVSPSPAASDEEWCRRTFLDILGRIPTADEVSHFVREKSPDKKINLVDRLLDGDRYVVEYARNWTSIWANQLIGRSGGMDPRRPVHREGLQRWLRTALLDNKSYDKFMAELVSADGSNTPGDKDFNGAVNFLLDNVQNHQISATNKVSELFLGTKISCTQCHDHPYNDRKQHAFWELNAFFRQTKARRVADGARPASQVDPSDLGTFARLVDEDFPGEGRPNLNEAAIFFERRNGFMKAAYPVFEGEKINPSGYVTLVNRRNELASRLSHSTSFRETAVNRTWAHFFGFGFVMPLDDMGPHNPPSHPELLAGLGEEFQSHGYNVKKLIRWIVLSEAYSLTSRLTDKNLADDPEKIDGTRGGRLSFSRFYPRQMEVEQVYESLRSMSHGSVHEEGKENNDVQGGSLVSRMSEADQFKAEREKHAWLQQFVLTFETDDNNETSTFDGTIPQALMMMNGDLVKRATRTERGSFLAQLAASKTHGTSAKKIEEVYRVVLGRKPSAVEQTAAQRLWVGNRGDALASLQDLSWVLLNSNEFIINH